MFKNNPQRVTTRWELAHQHDGTGLAMIVCLFNFRGTKQTTCQHVRPPKKTGRGAQERPGEPRNAGGSCAGQLSAMVVRSVGSCVGQLERAKDVKMEDTDYVTNAQSYNQRECS